MPQPTNPTVAVLGTGVMGAAMARSMRRAGLDVRVWNRTVEKAAPLAEVGARVADTAAQAAAGADVVMTMLFDADSVAAAIHEAKPAEGTIWLQTTTVGVDGADRLAGDARELGLVYVDAPVLGTKKPAEDGKLSVLASGPTDVADRLRPVFDAIGSRTVWLGDAGRGSRMKMVANTWVLGITALVGQAIALSRSLGLEPQQFLDLIKGSVNDSEYAQLKGASMIKREFPLSFALSGADKDAHLIADAVTAAGLPGALTQAIATTFDQAVHNADNADRSGNIAGADQVDFAAVVLGLERAPVNGE